MPLRAARERAEAEPEDRRDDDTGDGRPERRPAVAEVEPEQTDVLHASVGCNEVRHRETTDAVQRRLRERHHAPVAGEEGHADGRNPEPERSDPDRAREEAAREEREDQQHEHGDRRRDPRDRHGSASSGRPTEEPERSDGKDDDEQRERQHDRVERVVGAAEDEVDLGVGLDETEGDRSRRRRP